VTPTQGEARATRDARVQFERDGSGVIVALVMKDVDEPDSRHARGAD
jgi:hypothetical protein